MNEEIYWVYILLCENNSYYTGYTVDLEKRFDEHVAGKGAKYTRSFKPIRILQSWQIDNGKSAAMKIEKHIKTLSKKEKTILVDNPSLLEIK